MKNAGLYTCHTFARALATLACVSLGLLADAGGPVSVERVLRAEVEQGDFVIKSGSDRFVRPLYGLNSGFRIETGAGPEYALYLPGRNGTLRLAAIPEAEAGGGFWLHEAQSVVARYRSGAMIHEIADQRLGSAKLLIQALPTAARDGLIVRVESTGRGTVKLRWAFGGSDGDKGRRVGDLNAEREPLASFFGFKPERAVGHAFRLSEGHFELTTKTAKLEGGSFPSGELRLADGATWDNAVGLWASSATGVLSQVVVGEVTATAGQPGYVIIRPGGQDGLSADELGRLPVLFEQAEERRRALMARLVVKTPDPFIDAAAGAIAVAADAIWDEKAGVYMHGAVGWRVPLLGWRGAYSGDALGQHDRTRGHLEHFMAQQLTGPIPETLPPADARHNLARSEDALHSNGYFAGRDTLGHYDMNLMAVDTLFRHLLWTGDLALAKRMWPTLERHMAWERRLFRRPFGPGAQPLYEGYAAIWASDELFYSGGGATHATALNLWHNRMAARVAALIGEDPAPYEAEAQAIAGAMQQWLWLDELGWFGEKKDLLGRQDVHTSPAVWSFYHTADSQAFADTQGWQMSRFIETQTPRLMFFGASIPENVFTLSTTNWLPYTWSTNNVALAEAAHTALALWQVQRGDLAMGLFKGCLLESMCMGQAVGSVSMSSQLDVHSGERYRDFGDSVGAATRALVEGLFGIQPDLLAGQVAIRPGFPSSWGHASIDHAKLHFSFERQGQTDTFRIDTRQLPVKRVLLEPHAAGDAVRSVTVNGQPVAWTMLSDLVGPPRIQMELPAGASTVQIVWSGNEPESHRAITAGPGQQIEPKFTRATVVDWKDPQGVLTGASLDSGRLAGRCTGTLGGRTIFVRLQQGELSWWSGVSINIEPECSVEGDLAEDGKVLRLIVGRRVASDLPAIKEVTINGTPVSCRVTGSSAGRVVLEVPSTELLPGSHEVCVLLEDGAAVEGTITQWRLPAAAARWEALPLSSVFNDRVTQIFKNEYLSPRSPYCSLALPKQGIGGWCIFNMTADIDDAGVRSAALAQGGMLDTPVGVPFRTPGESEVPNIAFVSQWDNYPRQLEVPLSGRANRVVLLMAGSTNPMQSRMDNGEVLVHYADGSTARLALHNPDNWWPIDRDYYVDGRAFSRPGPIQPRLDLKTGELRIPTPDDLRRNKSRPIPGGSATVLDLRLDPERELKSLVFRALSNDVVIGLMAVTLERP